MRLCTLKRAVEEAAVVVDGGYLLVSGINDAAGTRLPTRLLDIIQAGASDALGEAVGRVGARLTPIPRADVAVAPLYRNPPKLWGIGLNYRHHADNLGVAQPAGAPGSYMRPNTTIIGPDDDLILPAQSNRVTAEAELGLVIGARCKDVRIDDAPSVIFGYTTVLDMTAEDLLRENLRYILRSKAFDTFCAIGPEIVTADEVTDVGQLRIGTYVNGVAGAEAPVSAMMYDPYWLVSFHSEMMLMEPGDIIATGTPGASVVRDGDEVECRIPGMATLRIHARAARTR